MKKRCLLLIACVLLLTGCSSSVKPDKDVTVKWDNGVISIAGKTTPCTSYTGWQAEVSGTDGTVYRFELETATDVTSLSGNYQEVLEENMDKYKGGFYYTEYLGTQFTYARNVGGDNWVTVKVTTNSLPATTLAAHSDEYLKSVQLTNGQVYVDFGDFVFGNAYDQVIVRTDAALITGVAKVSIGTHETTSTVSVVQDKKEIQLQKGSSSKYDYYVYGDYVIQVAAGLNISDYIKFK